MWGISQGEVAAMLQEGGQIPTHVQQLIDRRFCCLQRQPVQQHHTCVQGCTNAVLKLHSVHLQCTVACEYDSQSRCTYAA